MQWKEEEGEEARLALVILHDEGVCWLRVVVGGWSHAVLAPKPRLADGVYSSIHYYFSIRSSF